MTKKEFLNAVIANDITGEVIAEAQRQVDVLEMAKENAKIAKAEENSHDIDVILGVMTEELQSANELQARLAENGYEFSTQKIGFRMRLAEKLGLVELDWIPLGSKNHRGYKLAE